MTPTNIITRSEASHRLKLISSQVNSSVSAAREGHWRESFDAATEARRLLDAMIPHLEEAADVETELVGSLRYNPPNAPKNGKGAFGYGGKTHKPEPIARPADAKPPEPVKSRVFAMPAADAAPKPDPEPTYEVVTFDLSRIVGTTEFLSQFRSGTVQPLTPEELLISKRFERLPASTREKIETRYRETGKPVAMRMRPVEIKVGAHNG